MLNITTGLFKEIESKSETRRGIEAAQEQAAAKNKDEEKEYTRDWKLFQLDVNYRWSPIVLDERFNEEEASKQPNAYGTEGHEARAGDRAPDAPNLQVMKRPASEGKANIGEQTRLFDVFSPEKHTVLVFSPDGHLDRAKIIVDSLGNLKYPRELIRTTLVLTSISSITEDPGVDFIFRDTEGHAHTGYGIKDDQFQVVIVRPDGVIGAFVDGEVGVAKYFSLVFGEL